MVIRSNYYEILGVIGWNFYGVIRTLMMLSELIIVLSVGILGGVIKTFYGAIRLVKHLVIS